MRNWIFTAATRRERRKNERTKERKKECIESHLTRFTFRGRSFRLNSLQFPVTQCGNFKPHHRTVPHTVCVFDQIRSDQRGINQFECFHFVHKICRHLLHKPQSGLCMHVQACAGMCMLPLPVAHPHPVPVAILRQVV